MARLILLAHAPLASALAAVAGHAFPELADRIQALDVPPTEAPEITERRARQALDAPGVEPECLILTDVFGATPANIAQRVADRPGIRVVAGVNVPMLWRAMNYAALPVDDLVGRCVTGASQGILSIVSTRPHNQSLHSVAHDQQLHHHQQ